MTGLGFSVLFFSSRVAGLHGSFTIFDFSTIFDDLIASVSTYERTVRQRRTGHSECRSELSVGPFCVTQPNPTQYN